VLTLVIRGTANAGVVDVDADGAGLGDTVAEAVGDGDAAVDLAGEGLAEADGETPPCPGGVSGEVTVIAAGTMPATTGPG
jgi:hypothetical protein